MVNVVRPLVVARLIASPYRGNCARAKTISGSVILSSARQVRSIV